MELNNLNSKALRELIKLTDRKESLAREIGKIDAQLSSLILGKTAPVKKGRGRTANAKKIVSPAPATKKTPARPVKRAGRGALKKKIFGALRAAGDAGMKVPELSKKIGVKNQNVHVWFSSTGKKLPEIKRVGKGHFKLVEK
jgi:hypothetical protein